MIICDKNGGQIADRTFDAGISQLSVYKNYVYLVTDRGIARIEPKALTHELIETVTQGKSLLIREEDEVLLCGGQSAVYYKFN